MGHTIYIFVENKKIAKFYLQRNLYLQELGKMLRPINIQLKFMKDDKIFLSIYVSVTEDLKS